MPNPQQKSILSCSRQEYNNWRKSNSYTISSCRALKIRYCSSLKTNLFNIDLLTSVRTPTPLPNVIVISIIMKFLALGILKLVCFYILYVSCLFLHCHVSTLSCFYIVMFLHCHVCTLSCFYIFMFLDCHVSTLSCFYIVMFLHCHVSTLSCFYIVMFLHCHVSTLSCFYIFMFLHCHVSTLSCFYIVMFLHCHVFSYLSPQTVMKFQIQESVSMQ